MDIHFDVNDIIVIMKVLKEYSDVCQDILYTSSVTNQNLIKMKHARDRIQDIKKLSKKIEEPIKKNRNYYHIMKDLFKF